MDSGPAPCGASRNDDGGCCHTACHIFRQTGATFPDHAFLANATHALKASAAARLRQEREGASQKARLRQPSIKDLNRPARWLTVQERSVAIACQGEVAHEHPD